MPAAISVLRSNLIDDALRKEFVQPTAFILLTVRGRCRQSHQVHLGATLAEAQYKASVARGRRVVGFIENDEQATLRRVQEPIELLMAIADGVANRLQRANHHVVTRFNGMDGEVADGA